MKKIYVYLVSIICLMVICGCVVFAAGSTTTEKISNIPTTAITFEDREIDNMYKRAGKYFENVNSVSETNVVNTNSESINQATLERNITDAQAITIATNHISEILKKENCTNINVEFLLYTDINSGIEQRPVLVVTLENVMVAYSRGAALSSGDTTEQRPDHIETKILIDSLTGDVISLMCAGYND